MKNKILLIIILGMFLLSFASAYECQDQTEFWNIPCDLITPVIACATNANITYVNDTSINSMFPMTAVGDGTYNITFNYTSIGTYSIVLCDDTSGTIDVVVGTEESEPEFNLWLIMFIIFFVLFIVGVGKRNLVFIFFSGCLILVMGLWIFSTGTFSLYSMEDYWFVYPLGWILTGLGLILSIVSGINAIDSTGGDEE